MLFNMYYNNLIIYSHIETTDILHIIIKMTTKLIRFYYNEFKE